MAPITAIHDRSERTTQTKDSSKSGRALSISQIIPNDSTNDTKIPIK